MATENEGWGYTRILGELSKLGGVVSRSSVRRILLEHGLEPAPERLKHMPWAKFLRMHWGGLAAADFFTVEVWTKVGLIRYMVLFVIDLPTRRVEIAGISLVPNGLWTEQIARNLVDDMAGFLRGKTHLIHDRDPLLIGRLILGAGPGGAWRASRGRRWRREGSAGAWDPALGSSATRTSDRPAAKPATIGPRGKMLVHRRRGPFPRRQRNQQC